MPRIDAVSLSLPGSGVGRAAWGALAVAVEQQPSAGLCALQSACRVPCAACPSSAPGRDGRGSLRGGLLGLGKICT